PPVAVEEQVAHLVGEGHAGAPPLFGAADKVDEDDRTRCERRGGVDVPIELVGGHPEYVGGCFASAGVFTRETDRQQPDDLTSRRPPRTFAPCSTLRPLSGTSRAMLPRTACASPSPTPSTA